MYVGFNRNSYRNSFRIPIGIPIGFCCKGVPQQLYKRHTVPSSWFSSFKQPNAGRSP